MLACLGHSWIFFWLPPHSSNILMVTSLRKQIYDTISSLALRSHQTLDITYNYVRHRKDPDPLI